MEVRPGDKRTEVGVIPEDWDVKPLCDVAEFLDGRRRPVKDSERAKMRGDIPYYGASGIVDYVNDFLFDEDLILLGEDGENILSRNCRLAFKISGKTWVNNHAHVLRPKDGMALDYLVEYLESRDYAQFNTGTAQPKLNKQVCSGIAILCPPPAEQRAIAAALSDVDALLDGLERLIAKKRDLKQAAMQQLLTGQTRLPGFSGEWSKINVAKHAKLNARIGWQALTTEEYLKNGTHFLVTGTDFVDGRVNWATCHYVDEWRYNQDRNIQLKNCDVLLTKDGTIGKVGYVDGLPGPATLNSGVFVIRPVQEAFVPLFLFYVLASQIFDDFLAMITAGSTIVHLYQKDFVGFEFLAPDTEEQTAIATILSDMDAEIAALEARRDKTRALKQGMMQELLTGKTRLL